MACDCDNYIDCGDSAVEMATYSEQAGYQHNCNSVVGADNILSFFQKTSRTFSVGYGWNRTIDPGYLLTRCGDVEYVNCDSASSAIPHSSVTEHCKREINIPYFWDTQREIYVWKHIEEELNFDVSSNSTAKFKMKWGIGHFHKLCILDSTRTQGKEQFFMSVRGVVKLLAEVTYSYNPFPATEGGGATWGLYGNVVQRQAIPDTLNVACILLFPLVPKQAIPLDNDVIAYGFYDYNVTEGGFIESSLPSDDGGKDYFYPYWCRCMPTDQLWRETADSRYGVIYSGGKANLAGTTAWTPPSPAVHYWPFGAFALDNKNNFIASCMLQFGEHADCTGAVYNEANFVDLFAELTKIKLSPNNPFSTLYPLVSL